MEATFVVNPGEATPELIEQILHVFAGSEEAVVITVKPKPKRAVLDQRALFRQLEAVRLRTEKVPVPAEVDINALIDEINDNPL